MNSPSKKRVTREASRKQTPPSVPKQKASGGGKLTPAYIRQLRTEAIETVRSSFKGNVSDVINTMRRGVSAQIVPSVAERLGLSQDKLFERLRLPRSTMKARIGKNESLSATEQDRMYRADRVWDRAVAVLEDENAAREWITRENRSLGGESPLSLLDTEAGYELVLDTLGRIEYGVVA